MAKKILFPVNDSDFINNVNLKASSSNYELFFYSSQEKIISYLEENEDIVAVCIIMTPPNLPDFIKKIREFNDSLILIALLKKADEDQIRLMMHLKMDDFITQPFNRKNLSDILSNYIKADKKTPSKEEKNSTDYYEIYENSSPLTKKSELEKNFTLVNILPGIFHDINNSVNYITMASQNLVRKLKKEQANLNILLPDNFDESEKILKNFDKMISFTDYIKVGVTRIVEIGNAIKAYNRSINSMDDKIVITGAIEQALILLESKIKRYELIKNYSATSSLNCNIQNLVYVFTSILYKIILDMDLKVIEFEKQGNFFEGKIKISVIVKRRLSKNGILVTIEDSLKRDIEGIKALINDKYSANFNDENFDEGGVCENIILSHHGHLETDFSEPLGGARIDIWLPETI